MLICGGVWEVMILEWLLGWRKVCALFEGGDCCCCALSLNEETSWGDIRDTYNIYFLMYDVALIFYVFYRTGCRFCDGWLMIGQDGLIVLF